MRKLWNANTHYHSLVLEALPPGTSRVLDVGCGDGVLSADLLDAGVRHVIALDIDRSVLLRAQARHAGRAIEWMHGDVLQVPFEPDSFDAVVSVAALHHMDANRSLERFAQLVRPGGSVVVVGLAASAWSDLPMEAVAIAARQLLSLAHRRWDHSAPVCWPPSLTYGAMKAVSARTLPGVRYRRHLLGRYSLVWRRPDQAAATARFAAGNR